MAILLLPALLLEPPGASLGQGPIEQQVLFQISRPSQLFHASTNCATQSEYGVTGENRTYFP